MPSDGLQMTAGSDASAASLPVERRSDSVISRLLGGRQLETQSADEIGSAARPRAGMRRVTFVYLGRSPAFGGFVTSFARALARRGDIGAAMIVAEGTALAAELPACGVPVRAIPTFRRQTPGAVAMGFIKSAPSILHEIEATRSNAVVTLMPHVWSPLLAPRIRRRGPLYATVIHDADPHPGDPTAWLTRWLARDADHADVAIALSGSVAKKLAGRRRVPTSHVVQLSHPDLSGRDDDAPGAVRVHPRGRPLRVLFFGRIMAYKGLDLLVAAVEQLRARGIAVDLGVAGEGPLDGLAPRLAALGAEVINRWLPIEDVTALLARYDVVACSHIEASQSGVAALAFGNGLPVVATPVGGMREQVVTGQTGVLAERVDAAAFADAVAGLALEPTLFDAIARNLAATRHLRSMDTFVERLLRALENAEGRRRAAAPTAGNRQQPEAAAGRWSA